MRVGRGAPGRPAAEIRIALLVPCPAYKPGPPEPSPGDNRHSHRLAGTRSQPLNRAPTILPKAIGGVAIRGFRPIGRNATCCWLRDWRQSRPAKTVASHNYCCTRCSHRAQMSYRSRKPNTGATSKTVALPDRAFGKRAAQAPKKGSGSRAFGASLAPGTEVRTTCFDWVPNRRSDSWPKNKVWWWRATEARGRGTVRAKYWRLLNRSCDIPATKATPSPTLEPQPPSRPQTAV